MNKKQIVRLTESDIHSEESYNRAWENLWSQFDKNKKSINWAVYERYKGNPQAIKHWFDKWGIDVNEYLNEARNINKKQIVRLTESDLHGIVKESVNRILKEGYYDFDDYFNADDVECPYCGSNNVEPISAIDTHYRCLDCGEEFYLDSGWEPDWDAMRHESHKRKGKNINEDTTPTWKRWQGYTPDQKAERLAYMQQQIAQLKQQREYAKQKAKTARTPEEQQTWRNTKAQIDKQLLRLVSHEHDLRVGKKMTQGAKERAVIKRREERQRQKIE